MVRQSSPPKKSNTKHKYQLKYHRKWYHTLNWIAEECGFSMQKHENQKSHYLHQLHRDVILLTVLSCATNSFAHSLLRWIFLHAARCCLFVFFNGPVLPSGILIHFAYLRLYFPVLFFFVFKTWLILSPVSLQLLTACWS